MLPATPNVESVIFGVDLIIAARSVSQFDMANADCGPGAARRGLCAPPVELEA